MTGTLGHSAAENVLVQTAERLPQCLRKSGTVARLGADEFAILLSTVSAPGDAETVARKVIGEFARPMNIEGQDVRIGAGIGVAVSEAGEGTVDGLLYAANAALSEARKSGRNSYGLAPSIPRVPRDDHDRSPSLPPDLPGKEREK